MTGDARFALLMFAVAVLAVFTLLGLWMRGVLRQWWIRSTGCVACAYRNRGACACTRKCVNPDCKGAGR